MGDIADCGLRIAAFDIYGRWALVSCLILVNLQLTRSCKHKAQVTSAALRLRIC